MCFFRKLFHRPMSRFDVWLSAYSTAMHAEQNHQLAMMAADEVVQRTDALR